MEAAVKGLHPLCWICLDPVPAGSGGEKHLQFGCAAVPLCLETPDKGTVGFGEACHEIMLIAGYGNSGIGERPAQLLKVARLEGKGVYFVLQMDKQVVDGHGVVPMPGEKLSFTVASLACLLQGLRAYGIVLDLRGYRFFAYVGLQTPISADLVWPFSFARQP